MIHSVTIDNDDYLDLVHAADDAKMTIEQFEAWAVADAVNNWRRHKYGKAEFVAAVAELTELGVIPGGD